MGFDFEHFGSVFEEGAVEEPIDKINVAHNVGKVKQLTESENVDHVSIASKE